MEAGRDDFIEPASGRKSIRSVRGRHTTCIKCRRQNTADNPLQGAEPVLGQGTSEASQSVTQSRIALKHRLLTTALPVIDR